MRVGVGPSFSVLNSYLGHHFYGPQFGFCTGNIFVNEDRFDHLFQNRKVGVEATHGILKDHRDAFSPDGSKNDWGEVQEILVVEGDSPPLHLCGRGRKKAEHGMASDRLPGTGFTDHANDFPLVDGKGNIVNCPGGSSPGVEIGS